MGVIYSKKVDDIPKADRNIAECCCCVESKIICKLEHDILDLKKENEELKNAAEKYLKEVSKLKSYLNHVRNTLNAINDEMRIIIMQE